MSNQLITITDANLQKLGFPFSAQRAYKFIRDGLLPAVRVGARVFITESIVADFITAQTKAQVGPARTITRRAKAVAK